MKNLIPPVNFPVIRTTGRANHNNLHDGSQRVSHLALHSEPRLSQENLQDRNFEAAKAVAKNPPAANRSP